MGLGYHRKYGGYLPNLGINYSKTKAVPVGHGLKFKPY